MFLTKNFGGKDNVTSTIVKFLLAKQTKHEIVMTGPINFSWFNDNITRLMTYKQCVQYSVFAAELALPIFEIQFINDKRPRLAIKVAIKCIEDPSAKNKKTASGSAYWPISIYAADAASSTDDYSHINCASLSASYSVSADTANTNTVNTYYATSDSASLNKLFVYEMNKKKIMEYGLKLLQGL